MGRRLAILVAVTALLASVLGCSIDLEGLPSFDLSTLGLKAVSGDGNVVSEEREVGGFSSVALSGWGDLHIETGDTESLRIEAEENLLEYIETEVVDGRLEISHRQRVMLRPTTKINYYVTVKSLEGVWLSGAGNVEIPDVGGESLSLFISGAGKVETGALEVGDLEVEITGAGSVDVESLTGDSLDVEMSGAGDMSVMGGEVREQEVGISGGGNYQAKGLQSAEAKIRLSGLGNATVRVSDHLRVNISGAGSVEYVGDPVVEKNVSGVGSVRQTSP